MRRLLAAAILLGAVPGSGLADWGSDEIYVQRLQKRVEELRRAVALFERHRRSLELVEAEIANVQLGLADPRSKPDDLVRRLLRDAYPRVTITMKAARPRAPRGIAVWTWGCELKGAISELRWATQLLRQKGLFIQPAAREPVQLLPEPDQRRGKLVFIGHHIRLKEIVRRELPDEEPGADIFATRTDPLAVKIKQLRSEVGRLRKQVLDIQGFEARINSIRQYVDLLSRLAKSSRDPFQAITPLLDLELIRFRAIRHLGDRVVVEGEAPSPTALSAARSWLDRQSRRGPVRIRHEALRLLYKPPSTAQLPVPDSASPRKGPRCTLIASGARSVDLARVAARQGAAVVLQGHRADDTISGATTSLPCDHALAAAAHSMDLALVTSGPDVVALPRKHQARANALLGKHPRKGPLHAIDVVSMPLGQALSMLRDQVPGILEAPRATISSARPISLVGNAPVETWLRLVAATRGLQVTTGKDSVRLVPSGSPKTVLFPVPDAKPAAAPAPVLAGLSQLRLRLLVLGRGNESLAVVSDPAGVPTIVKRGVLLGRNRSQVVRIDKKGLTLLWSGGGVTARLILPPGETR